jgi:hypothetical protein
MMKWMKIKKENKLLIKMMKMKMKTNEYLKYKREKKSNQRRTRKMNWVG